MRRRVLAGVVGMLQLAAACYSWSPVRVSPDIGAQLALEVNDEGRVALNRTLGPGVVRLEGKLAVLENEAYLLDASSVTQIRSVAMPIDGIRVRVNREHVVRVDVRRLDRTRTWVTMGAAALITVGFFLSKGFFGRSTPAEGPPGPGGPDQ